MTLPERVEIIFPAIQWRQEGGRVDAPALPGDAGFDLVTSAPARWKGSHLGPVRIPLGVRVALPPGYFALLLGRSSATTHFGVQVLPSVIDGGYRGPLFAHVLGFDRRPGAEYLIPAGVRLCQLVPLPLSGLALSQQSQLPPSDRGEAGFGSTGGLEPSEEVRS
jgi:dUTP pyrophosphatase